MPQATHDDAGANGAPIRLTSVQVRRLEPDHLLVLGVAECVVVLCREGMQSFLVGRFTAPGFRLFVVLLLAEDGASYAELYAGLRCKEECFRAVLARASLQVAAFQEEVQRQRLMLDRLTREELKVEHKQIRRVLTGPSGVAGVLEAGGFGWKVENAYGRGYRLVSANERGTPRATQLTLEGYLLEGVARQARNRPDNNQH
jgi:hypothetical protein